MKFGLSGRSGGLESLSEERMRDFFPIVEELGFSSMWINEEHFQRNNAEPHRHGYSPLMLAAVAAALTTRLRVGFSALLLPLHQPLRLAEEIATLDRLSGGRVDFGISRGHAGRYFEAFGIDPDERTVRFRMILKEILGYWQGGKLALSEEEALFAPLPFQLPHPPIYVAAYSDESVEWIARSGYGLIQHGIQSMDSLRRCMQVFEEYGGRRETVPVGRFIYVGESNEEAHKEIGPVVSRLTQLLKRIRTQRFSLIHDESDLNPETFVQQLAIVGSPQTCADKLKMISDELGATHINLLSSFFGLLPAELLEQSLRRFSADVMPKFSQLSSIR